IGRVVGDLSGELSPPFRSTQRSARKLFKVKRLLTGSVPLRMLAADGSDQAKEGRHRCRMGAHGRYPGCRVSRWSETYRAACETASHFTPMSIVPTVPSRGRSS